ncbi:outer membrane protein assembly factor [Leptobacterium flavescens]|uniref:Outer membrane protein assembly factor n=1 Tax=Leptobacterium flavescens TaxID=472055 RepID=A0A6P0UL83_9FLAO|nr:POTRA domain-containing protein [Leptobacterium flavescens]NER14025.1 outer membrane protein assembly factor [Leptobacterium flavescens]
MRSILLSAFLLITSVSMAQNTTGNPKIISELKIEGLKKTKESLIRKIARVEAGQELDTVAIAEDIERLKRLASTAYADYEITHKENGEYIVTYRIEENFTIIPGLNIFTANNGDVAFRVAIFEFNLFGQNITTGGFFLRDVFNSYGGYWEAPYLFSDKLGVSFNHKNNTTFEPIFFNDSEANYKYENKNYEAKLLYNFDFHHRAELGINYTDEDYEFLEGATSPDVPLTARSSQLAYRALYEYANVDIVYQYITGVRVKTTAQYINNPNELLNSSFIGTTEFQYFAKIGQKGNWATRTQALYASNTESAFAPFVVDNNLNIRGSGNIQDRGTAALILNTEYRHTFYEKGWFVFQGNVFVDASTWRNPNRDLSELIDGSTLRVNPGIGVRFIHKRIFNAVIRLDYGFGITDNGDSGLVFGIGQFF